MIERRIIIALATNTEYAKEVLKNQNIIQYFDSSSAKHLAKWIVEYFEKYQKSPGHDMEGIFLQKSKEEKLSTEDTNDISDILQGLSDESNDEPITDFQYLLDQTFRYLQERQATIFIEKQKQLVESGNMDEFCKLQSTFKPIVQCQSTNSTGFNALELYDMEIKPKEWLINDLLPKGLTIFAGKAKLGKSYLVLNMMTHLVRNEYMFSDDSSTGFRGSPGRVLYLALEDTQERIKQRLHDIEPSKDNKLRLLRFELQWKKLYAGGLKDLEDWINSVKNNKPRLIVIDVIAKVWDIKSSTSGGRQYAEEYAMYSPLADLAHKYNISIIAITHTKKGKESDVFDEILGGAGTQGSADNLMVLSSYPQQHDKRILAIRGKDVEEKHLIFETSNKGADWFCLGESEEVQKTDQRQSIYNYLSDGWKSLEEIKRAARDGEIQVSANSVNSLLRKMVNDGNLEQDKPYGKYAVAGTIDRKISLRMSKKIIRTKNVY